jgi:hypothetical protein
MTKDVLEATSDTVASATTNNTSTEPPTTGGTSSTTASNSSSTPPTNSSTISHDALLSSLCSSCDSCRTRKTKCDGRRPCGSCTAKYLKKLKVERYAIVLWKLLEHWTVLQEKNANMTRKHNISLQRVACRQWQTSKT